MGYNEEKQRQLDMRYLRMARIWAENSYCVRRKVGALIVKDKMIISDGYNGTPSGFENVCEDENGKTKPYVLHAEANAITKVAKSANNCDGSTLYITAAPCIECSKLIIQAGIKRVVYCEEYRSEEGLDLLRKIRQCHGQFRIHDCKARSSIVIAVSSLDPAVFFCNNRRITHLTSCRCNSQYNTNRKTSCCLALFVIKIPYVPFIGNSISDCFCRIDRTSAAYSKDEIYSFFFRELDSFIYQ